MTVSQTREGRIIRPQPEGREQRSQALGTEEPGLGNRRTRLWEQENQALGMADWTGLFSPRQPPVVD